MGTVSILKGLVLNQDGWVYLLSNTGTPENPNQGDWREQLAQHPTIPTTTVRVSQRFNGSSWDTPVTDGVELLLEGQVAKSDGSGGFVYAGATADPATGEWTFDKSIEVPQASVKISDTLSISEATLLPITRDKVASTNIVNIGSTVSDTQGSSLLNFEHVPSGQVVTAQPDFSTNLTSNPLVVPLLATLSNQTDRVTLRTGSAISNFRAVIVDSLTGIALKYIPSKEVVNSGVGGLELPVGDVVFHFNDDQDDVPSMGLYYLGFTPLRQSAGQASTLILSGDTMDILGEPGGIPYIVNEIHFLEPTTVPFIENVTNLADPYTRLGNKYSGLSGTTGGVTVNYLATSTTDTITSGQFTAGIASTTNPTVITDTGSLFSSGELIQIIGTVLNDGLYEVLSHTGVTLSIKGVGLTGNVEGFTASDFITTVDSGSVTKVNVSVARAGEDGIWEQGFGSSTPIEFSKLGVESATIERILNATSIAATQNPTGLGPANAIQIEFGPAQLGPTDPLQIDAAGTVTFNKAGLYRIKFSSQLGRTGAGSVSELLLRVLVNGVQAGRTVAFKLDNSNVIIPYTDEAWLNFAASATVSFEIMRDSSGNNSGGLIGQDVTVEPGSWSQDVCVELRVERWRS